MPSRLERSIYIDGIGSNALVADLGSRLAIVVTHPWGPLGGSLHNNVVSAVVLYFQRLGISTLRFNFGGSQIGRGLRQVRQVEEAAKFLLFEMNEQRPPQFILLVGYSYGSLITGSASARIPQCIGSISIAPPWSVKHWLLMFHSNFHLDEARRRARLPRCMILGSRDNFTSEEFFLQIVGTFPTDYTTGAVLKGADHFFARREKDLMDVVGQWLMEAYPQCEGNLERLANLEFLLHLEELAGTMSPKEKRQWGGIFGNH